MPTPLDVISFDWGIRCFGSDHMQNVPIRTLRMVEEAVEVAQAAQLDKDQLHQLVDIVYSRPRGDIRAEVGGLINTTRVLCMALMVEPEDAQLTEIRRCLAKSPEHFAKRNEEKLQLGLTGAQANDPEYFYAYVRCGRKAWHLGNLFADWEELPEKFARGDYVENHTFRKKAKDATADDRQLARDYAEPLGDPQ